MSLNIDALTELENSTAAAGSLDSAFNNEAFSINFTGVETSPPLWPKGRYLMKVTEVERKVSKGGTAYALLTLTCQFGQYKGKKQTDMLMLEGKGLPRTLVFLESAGLIGADKQFKGTLNDFVGKVFWVSVIQKEEEYEGEKSFRNRIGFRGYEPVSKHPIPADGDVFAEEFPGPRSDANTFPATVPGGSVDATTVDAAKPAWE